MGRPPKADAMRKPCPRKGHSRREVTLYGLVRGADGNPTHQRFMCAPGTEQQHTFRVAFAPKPIGRKASPVLAAPVRPYSPPEPCLEHPGGRVRRRGTYKQGKRTRQRYECVPLGWYEGATRKDDPEHAKHSFTPALPRTHVDGDDKCPHCAEMRAVNRGETAVARQHQADTTQVVEALTMLGDGKSYAEVSKWLQGKVRKDGTVSKGKDAWRRAADIAEVFAPVLWQDWLTQVAVQDADRQAAKPSQPRVVMLDDLPMFSKATKYRKQAQRFAVLGVGEVLPGGVRLRLLRAFPQHDQRAYMLLLDELGWHPDFVIADGGKAIRPAVLEMAALTRHDTQFVACEYHMRQQLGAVIDKAAKATSGFDAGSLRVALDTHRCWRSRTDWETWFADLERRMAAQKVPLTKRAGTWKKNHYQFVCDQLDAMAVYPDMPRTTGALETLLADKVKPSMTKRSRALGNLARTNQLLDLFVLHANGYFHDPAHAAEALRTDAANGDPTNPGWAPPVRQLCDPGLYRSLLDPDMLADLFDQAGL